MKMAKVLKKMLNNPITSRRISNMGTMKRTKVEKIAATPKKAITASKVIN